MLRVEDERLAEKLSPITEVKMSEIRNEESLQKILK